MVKKQDLETLFIYWGWFSCQILIHKERSYPYHSRLAHIQMGLCMDRNLKDTTT